MIHAGFLVSRATQGTGRYARLYGYGAVTRYGPTFQTVLLMTASHVPALLPRKRLDASGLGSSPFARRYSGSHFCFLLLPLLRCFSSRRSPHLRDATRVAGSPIRAPPDQRLFAPPRGFSQLIAPFFASWSQGILRTPLSRFSS